MVISRYSAGYDTRTLDRQVFLRKLYERLPDRSKVREKARVEEIIEESSKTRVILADGREFVRDVVVGADSVHSKVREIMWDKANAANPGMITVKEKRAMVTQYNAIVMAWSPVPGVTSNSALGGNTAMEDAVTLANTINALLGTHFHKSPSDFELRDAMRDKHQNARVDHAWVIVKVVGDLTRQQAYDGWKAYFVQRWLTPIVGLDTLAKNIAGLCVMAPKLTYVDFDEKRGILGWQDTLSAVKEREAREEDERLNSGPSWGDLNGGFASVFPQGLAVLVAL
ncbi:hypothetical protein CABS01_08334 [Colletotrichum abscissum]|uniref:uncharacterized protein n=1 Tax=Colletotrichum abscissum TaxID=1671311 RepID=UPI0027D4BF87|nr:uncharacterized protein CABS01_08334 [Colletotrichum abscissum]KAK1507154.1 hypothetical protein CABS01_08334 [Colletotrichum abscissum]